MPSTSLDLLCIGESLRDVFYMLDEASITCSLNREKCLLCMEYAEKIPVEHIVKVHAAGNSSNVAVGAARMGLTSALLSWVGQDTAGADIIHALQTEGVDNRFVLVDTDHPTSEATILVYQGERTQLVHFEPCDYRVPKLPLSDAVYYSAMGWHAELVDEKIVQHVNQHSQTRLIFQPGTTHIRAGLTKLKPLIEKSWLFILNQDEAKQLLGDGRRPMRNLLEKYRQLGAQLVVITDGPNGADAFDGQRHWHMPIFPGKAIERTGAGDSFACGVTCALLQGEDLPTALRWGAANSQSVVMQIGPQAGLLTKSELTRQLKVHATVQPILVSDH